MWHYLKAAFWARPEIPGLGRVPANLLAVIGLGLLGFGHQGFWLAGLAAETAYLYALTTNDRFRKLVDADALQIEDLSAEQQRQQLIRTLLPARRERLEALQQKCARILELHRDAQSDAFIVEGDTEALQKIEWLHLKLLVAQQNIASLEVPSARENLKGKIEALKKDLCADKISASLRESKEATLKILQQRLANLDRRDQTLEEIESDLTRIEAQVDLALENTGMRGKTETISANIDLVSHLLDDSIYGDSGASIAALDQTYGEKA
ncbi:MAG: hypothetical protein QM796_14835 [Chthoniobacteraceae bacterium]